MGNDIPFRMRLIPYGGFNAALFREITSRMVFRLDCGQDKE
jgi:hypothetical protein